MPYLGSLWNVTHMYLATDSVGALEVERVWFNGKIVWVPKSLEEKYLRIHPHELYLYKENNYHGEINIVSNTSWIVY